MAFSSERISGFYTHESGRAADVQAEEKMVCLIQTPNLNQLASQSELNCWVAKQQGWHCFHCIPQGIFDCGRNLWDKGTLVLGNPPQQL